MILNIVLEDGTEKTFTGVKSFNATQVHTANEKTYGYDVAETPTEGMLFEVNPFGIDRSKFKNPLSDQNQESRRQMIQDAFAKLDMNPQKYACPYYILIPKKNWDGYKAIEELEECSNNLGGRMSDCVELALMWAQQICNGESWEDICNKADTNKCYRLVVWDDGSHRVVGGSSNSNSKDSASEVRETFYFVLYRDVNVVPLVTIKKK